MVPRAHVQVAAQQADFQTIAQHMFALMFRNVCSDGFRFTDPVDPQQFSAPGCVVAAPAYPANDPGVDQDYVFNWVRDGAITALEIVAAAMPVRPDGGVQPVIDYVTFAKTCQDNAAPTLAHACYTIEGQPRPWTEQADGPALQTVTILAAWHQLDQATQAVGTQIIDTNLSFLLKAYQEPTTNLWEEHLGYSFFARAAQLRCLREVAANGYGIAVPPGTSDAIAWLESALSGHWDGSKYVSMMADPGNGAPPSPQNPVASGYDPNIDIVQSAVYCAIPVTDTKLLATAALLRQQWDASSAATVYPINIADHDQHGIGPLMGRYPGDHYDGDVAHPVTGGHPWALCTCNFAELYYRLGTEITQAQAVPFDDLSSAFFGKVGVGAGTAPADAVAALDQAGDAMLQAVIYHSDNLELSEQFDGTTGYEKSVHNLTWSYAAFLSAVRAKSARNVQG